MPEVFGPIPGLRVGHAQDLEALTGCTVLLCEQRMTAACDVRGGAVGEREFQTLSPEHIVESIHALVFAGGSAFGLEAATGVMRWCEEHEIGFDTGIAKIPIVPAAIVFDLRLGKAGHPVALSPRRASPIHRPRHPDAEMGYAAAANAAQSKSGAPIEEGNIGAGTGCTVGKLLGIDRAMKAGVGCWTETVLTGEPRDEPLKIAALAVVNAFGDIRDADKGNIIAGARAQGALGGGARRKKGSHGFLDTARAMQQGQVRSSFADPNTVLVAVATNARLTRLEVQRMARMASAGMARVVSPAHTTFDGDVIFGLSISGEGSQARGDVNALGAAAAEAVARAIVRGVTQARSAGGLPGLADSER